MSTKTSTKRSESQNKAMHLYFTMLADELNGAGLDMKHVLKPSVEISWTKENVKEYIWKPIQKALKLKDSTSKLDTKEVSMVWEIINRHFGTKFGIHVPFPTEEQTQEYLNSIQKKL